ncbi:MAG TPA: N-acetylmuramoyl-L-alanine amidase [Candidatus Limnocylindrales bacterium]
MQHHRRHPVFALSLAFALAASLTAAGPTPQPAKGALPLAGIVIAIDPGHNGGNASHVAYINHLVWIGNRWKACDTVGTSTRSGWPEHRFTWLVAGLVKAKLQALGATVVLSRNSDTGYGPCVNTRGTYAAAAHARLKVSIHADGALSADHGFFVMKPGLVPGYTNDILTSSARLATTVRTGLLRAGLGVANYYATNGIKTRTDLGGLNMSDVPAVMVELGNMKNAGDAARMLSSSGRNQYASGLVAGIRLFLGR